VKLALTIAALTVIARPSMAQHAHDHDPMHPAPASDTAYAAMQARGAGVMGVDQYTSRHVFEPLPDGGRIELQRSVDDSAGIAQIRRHLHEVAEAFARGDFTAPSLVHLREVPGTAVMAARRALIDYRVGPLPRGAELRITTTDSDAVAAVHEFLAFQRGEHRAPAH
jgi:hypothetical protein